MSQKIDWTTLGFQRQTMPAVDNINITTSWQVTNIGSPITFNVENGGKYLILAHVDYALLNVARTNFSESAELGLSATSGSNTASSRYYQETWVASTGNIAGMFGASHMIDIQADGNTITLQRYIRGDNRINNGRYGSTKVVLLRVG